MKKKLFLIPIFVAGMTLIACGGSNPGPEPTGTFTVTWNLNNGTNPIKETYKKGETPTYKHEIDYKEGHTPEYGYLFKSWDKPIAPVTSDITYTATYEEEESVVVTTIVLMYLQRQNFDHFEFHYTGTLKNVDWGDGAINQSNEHVYNDGSSGPEKYPTYFVTIYGNLTSISFADESGLYGKTNKAIKSVTLSSTITSLPDNAMNGLYVANSILLNKNLKHVGKNVMNGLANDCLIFTEPGISFDGWDPDWNTGAYRVVNNIKKVGLEEDGDTGRYFGYLIQKQEDFDYLAICSYFSQEKTDVTSITIPDKLGGDFVNAIIYNPFGKYYKVTSYDLTNTTHLLYIGNSSFKDALMESFALPSSVIEIGEYAFNHCYKMTNFTIPNDSALTWIGAYAFHYLAYLDCEISIPSGVDYIGPHAFDFCSKLKINNLENTKIKEIYDSTFLSCGITSIGLPVTLGSIDSLAFAGCDNLTEVDATKFTTKEAIPACDGSAFDDVDQTVTIKVNSAFIDEATAKAAFTDKGWPSAPNFTYQVA